WNNKAITTKGNPDEIGGRAVSNACDFMTGASQNLYTLQEAFLRLCSGCVLKWRPHFLASVWARQTAKSGCMRVASSGHPAETVLVKGPPRRGFSLCRHCQILS